MVLRRQAQQSSFEANPLPCPDRGQPSGLYNFQNGPRGGGALRSGGGTICRIDPAAVRFQANTKCFNTPDVLEHSPENRETVECISQFAMLLGVCNRQSP